MIEKKRAPTAASQPQEYVPAPELEYAALRSVPEFQPPPPEFGQKTVPEPEPEKKRRLSLRSLLAIPAIGLLGFFGFRMLKPAQPQEPEPPPSVTEPAETLPEETAEPIPVLPTGSVILDVDYAVRDGDLVLYKYDVYTPEPSLDATQAQIDAYNGPIWPVSVYAQVSDSANNAVYPETDPDVWEDYRYSDEEYVINAAGLEGDLTLTLRAVYLEQGEERQTVAILPLAQLPPTPVTYAELTALGGNEVSFTAYLKPQSGDGSDFDLVVAHMDQCAYSEEEKMYFSLVDNPAEVPVEYDPENGFTVRYTGGSALQSIPADAELSLAVSLRDRNTGYIYDIESNRVAAPNTEALPEYPLETGNIVITVYNDTMTFDVASPVDTGDWLTVLAVDAFPVEEFTEYALPEPIAPAGYAFQGWVVHVNNPFDMGSEENLFELYNGDPPVDILTSPDRYAFPVESVLTREDVTHVPPDAEGNRFVNVHAVWIKEEPSANNLFLDDGNGNVTAYDMDVPLASEGYLYLCRYPVPEREGWRFTGWYDSEGNRVDLLVCYFSFIPMLYNEDGDFIGYDWNTSAPVYLTAGWAPDS